MSTLQTSRESERSCDNRGINRCSLLSVNLWTNRLLAAAAQTDPCIYVSYVLTAWIVWGRVRLIPAIFSWESTQKIEFKNGIITTINLIPQNNWKIWSMYVLFFFYLSIICIASYIFFYLLYILILVTYEYIFCVISVVLHTWKKYYCIYKSIIQWL